MDLIPIKLSKVGKFLGKGKTKLSKKCYIKLKLKHQLRSSHEENTILVSVTTCSIKYPSDK